MRLRRIKDWDLKYLFEWRNDPAIYKWCRQFAPLHFQDHCDWLEKQRVDPKIEMFAMDVDDKLVGVCGLTDIDMVNRRAEFSLYVGPEYWHQGFAKDGLISLFEWGFHSLGLNRIYGESFDGNRAIKMFEKLGLEHEGTRRDFYYRSGNFVSAHLYSISAADFNRLHGS